MRFCNLKTYLSACRQLIVFHPSIFISESELGLFIATITSSFFPHCGSRLLIPAITPSLLRRYPLIRVRHLLLESSCAFMSYGWCLPVTNFRRTWGVVSFPVSIIESFRACLSTEVMSGAPSRCPKSDGLYLYRLFPTQGHGKRPISLYPLVSSYDGSIDTLFNLPVRLLLAVGTFSNYYLFLLSPPLYTFDNQSWM